MRMIDESKRFRAATLLGVFACTVLVGDAVRAVEAEEATLIVDRVNDPSKESMDFTLDGALIGKAKLPGRVYKFKFKVGTDNVTDIKETYIGTFQNSSITRRIRVFPGGTEKYVYYAAEFEDLFRGGKKETIRQIGAETLNSGIDASTLKVTLDDERSEKEVASEVVATPAGVKRTVKRTRTIEHSVSHTKTKSVELAVDLNFGVISGGIRGKAEKSLNQTFRQSESIEQSLEIDGSVLPRAKIVWVERAVTGKASVVSNGEKAEIPFTLSETLELRVIPLK